MSISNVHLNFVTELSEPLDRVIVILHCFLSQLGSPQDLASVPEMFSELLQAAGFRKILTENNKEEAVAAVKCHFVFYEKRGPLLQYMECQFTIILDINCYEFTTSTS